MTPYGDGLYAAVYKFSPAIDCARFGGASTSSGQNHIAQHRSIAEEIADLAADLPGAVRACLNSP
jgi:hypothetical protein